MADPPTGRGASAIGVFDSGIGGLTVLDALTKALPDQDFLYLGDNRNAPYGERDADEIFSLTVAGVRALFDRGCRLVILACNTASAVALRRVQENWLPGIAPERRVLGVFVPMIEALTGRPWAASGPPIDLPPQTVGLFATPATVASGAFRRELVFRARGIRVVQVACPGLVEALEAADRKSAERLVVHFCDTLLAEAPELRAAVLGCTHYPLLADSFRSALPPPTRLLSQPDIVAESLVDYLRRHPRFRRGTGHVRLVTTGDSKAVTEAARRLTGQGWTFEPV